MGTLDWFATPYLPYISNCKGYDSYIPLFELMEHPDCKRVGVESTEEMNLDSFLKPSEELSSDVCDLSLKCRYEETYAANTKRLWFTMQRALGNFFYITRHPMSLAAFNRISWENVEKLQGATLHSSLDPYDKVIVQVCRDSPEGVSTEGLTDFDPKRGETGRYPTLIELHVGYLQSTKTYKQIVRVEICFRKFISIEADVAPPEYDFRFRLYPMSGMQILDDFGFPLILPVIFTLIIAIGISIAIVVLRLYGKANTVVIPQPKLSGVVYLQRIVRPAMLGFSLQYMSIMFVISTLYLLFHDEALFLTESFKIDRDSAAISTVQTKRAANFKRFGMAFLLTGIYVIVGGAYAIIPVPKKEKQGIFSKTVWQRTHFFYCKIVFCLAQSLIVIFTRISFYKENVFACTILIAIVQNILTTLIRQWLPDTLYLTSFMMVKNIVSKTCSLGVATFLEFMVTYCTQLVQGILTRALMPIVKRYQLAFSNTVANSRWFRRKRLNLLSAVSAKSAEKYERGLRSGGLKTRKAYQAAQILQKEMAVNDLYKNAIQFVAAMFSPAFTLFIFTFSAELGITTSFGQRDLLFYVMFGLIMLLFQFLFDLLVQNYVEMRYGWKLNMYLKQASEIFANRPKAWIFKCPVAVESREITKKFRSIDRMCFSAQFYFVAAHITFGCLLSVYGLMVVINGGYEIFKDDALPFLALYTFALCYAGEVIAVKGAKQVLLWHKQDKEEVAELKEIEFQRKKRKGKSSAIATPLVERKAADESSAFAKNKMLSMLVDDNTLDIFRHNVQTVYKMPTGLTPTEMAMRINHKGSTIKNALALRTAQLRETAVSKKFASPENTHEKGLVKANAPPHGKTTHVAKKAKLGKSLYEEAKQDQTKRVAEESRRGSVRWDTMERLNDPASEVHKDETGEKMELGSDPTTNLSSWVPMEYYDTRYIYGKPKLTRSNK